MAIGQNFYAEQPEQDFANLSGLQSAQAMQYGDKAAQYADPFMSERGQYQNQLSELMKNPGSFASSPTYQFAFQQGLDALNRRSAATGKTGSGNYLAELMKYGQRLASQQFFPQANLLAQLAQGGSSPAAAGLAFARGGERSQDYAQMSAAARAMRGPKPEQSQGGMPNWLKQHYDQLESAFPRTANSGTGLPSGGYSAPGTYSPYGGAGYMPSSQAGTGYMLGNNSDAAFGGGTTDFYDFGAPGGGYDWQTPSDMSYDYGGGFEDYGGVEEY